MKHIVITGGSRGIGYALARRFLELGCLVTIAGRSEASSRAAEKKLAHASAAGADTLSACACDVSKAEELEALWQHAAARAPVDIWINNAGVSPALAPFWELPAQSLREVMDTNVRGVLLGCWVAMRGMRAQKSGVIYNLVGFGVDGMMFPGALAYGASKRAVGYITKALAREARGSGVRVCNADPGAVRTDMVEGPWRDAAAASRVMAAVVVTLALEPDELAALLAPRLLSNQGNGNMVRPWNTLLAWLRLLLVPLALLRGTPRAKQTPPARK